MARITTIHYSTNAPGMTGKARARCGQWTRNFTADPSIVTCSICLRLLRKPTTTMSAHNAIKSAASAALAVLLTAACGPLPPDDSESGGESGSTAEQCTTDVAVEDDSERTTGQVVESGSDDASTSTSSDTTTGECAVSPCTPDACDDGETCLPDPSTGVLTCVGHCEALGELCEAEVCGELVPGVCVADPLGLGWCYPN